MAHWEYGNPLLSERLPGFAFPSRLGAWRNRALGAKLTPAQEGHWTRGQKPKHQTRRAAQIVKQGAAILSDNKSSAPHDVQIEQRRYDGKAY
jgi:hypothetical protein